MSDTELATCLADIRAERQRLRDLLDGDRVLLGHVGREDRPLGKLRVRMTTTSAKWKDYGARQTAVEMELALRQARTGTEWDEPTETDLDRLSRKLHSY